MDKPGGESGGFTGDQQYRTTEGNLGAPEKDLKSQLAEQSQQMIAKLKELGLADPSAPGVFIWGEEGKQMAIFLGRTPVNKEDTREISNVEFATFKADKHLIISPNGFFLADGDAYSSAHDRNDLSSALNRNPQSLSIKEGNKLEMIDGHSLPSRKVYQRSYLMFS